ncbi:MAG: hypothetical protein COU31_05240 [Candidatus Magasanikbacteria bacterium CG10_big_fil_rev_8_21_14_0_10_40_10]|uniref:Gluconeogenesis factor n=1 Tax=Candidatus Magasanikbacteria bacterium CG10_big_fil_rev_8_21_14_0_10_40_10 TaxID=1974648 RepID=A0A2M6W2K0_9BACT|nr:MAG: hypothetical protein COU31_05240 [Candidatus Magasanikbacteria bacterium CG10_big_fil_rev_8_21_14_0_10_40_10]
MNKSQSIKKKVVVMGGGNGSAVSLNALKLHTDIFAISAVTSMVDDGYSTGAMRKKFGILPPGDIMRASVAMSTYPYSILKSIFYKNRPTGLKKLNAELDAERCPSLGNLFLLFVSQYEGDFVSALRALEEAVEAVGHAYPSTLEQSNLVVALSNGQIITGEHAIDEPTHDRSLTITRAWLEPEVPAYHEALQKIREADCIILGPGDLYTSVIASLLPQGIREAMQISHARLVYVAGNAYHTEGEASSQVLSGFISALESYLPRVLDRIVYNSAVLDEIQRATYRERGWSLIDWDDACRGDERIVAGDYEKSSGGLDSEKLGGILKELSSEC